MLEEEVGDIKDLSLEILQRHFLSNTAVLEKYGDDRIAVAIAQYWATLDHGFAHSLKVWDRCQQLMEQCPEMWRFIITNITDYKTAVKTLMWSSVFHDFSRFIPGVAFEDHEGLSAQLALDVLKPGIGPFVYEAVAYHDYFCPLVDGRRMPFQLMDPLAEIFRLADKTSISPAEEVKRCYDTGKRLDTPFFDQSITIESRFPLRTADQVDELSFLLTIWLLQPEHFFFRETACSYADWQKGLPEAKKKLVHIAAMEIADNGYDPGIMRDKVLGHFINDW